MLNEFGSPTVSNCTFTDNYAKYTGAGMSNGSGNPTLTNCSFIGNSAGESGGGMSNHDNSSPTVTNCTFSGNVAERFGGGMYNHYDSSPIVTNCTFSGNSACESGGGMYNFDGCGPTVKNCTFNKNSAASGGGICNEYDCHITLTNCILWGNRDCGGMDESAQVHNVTTTATIDYCCIQGWTGNLGGTGNIDNDPCFVETGFFNSVSYWKFDETTGMTAYDSVGSNHGTVHGAQRLSGQVGGAFYFDGWNDYVDMKDTVKNYLQTNYTISVWIKTNKISSTEAFSIIAYRHSTDISPVLFALGQDHADIHFAVRDNSHNLAQPVFTNVLTTNTWYHIAGVREENVLNVYVNGVSGIPDSAAFGEISPDNLKIGTIMFGGNPHTNFFHGSIDDVIIFDRALSAEEIQQHYHNGLSGQPYPDANTPDYHLLPDSPCINAGDPDYPFDPNETDLDGKPRVIGGRIDMGAYEFEFQNTPPVADAGQDQTVEAKAPWGATVTLDGSGSSDADSSPGTNDDIVYFDWYKVDPCDPNIDVFLGSGEITDCNFPIGEHIIVLEVIDKAGAYDTNEVTIIVQDTTPPDFELSVSPTMLWPPNHKMHEITPSWTVSDECDVTPDVSLVGIVMNECDNTIGDGHTTDDIQIGEDGSIYLRAERSGTGSNRVYTITYQAVDDSGNVTVRSATVSIPHDFKVLTRIKSR
jgi:predicted outer membrane repeat protein